MNSILFLPSITPQDREIHLLKLLSEKVSVVWVERNQIKKTLRDFSPKKTNQNCVFWVNQLSDSAWIKTASSLGYKTVFNEPSAESTHWLNRALMSPERWKEGLRAAWCAWKEDRVCHQVDLVLTSSEFESARILKGSPRAKISIIGAEIDTDQWFEFPPANSPRFAVISYLSGQDRKWLKNEIEPRLKSALGEAMPPLLGLDRSEIDLESTRRALLESAEIILAPHLHHCTHRLSLLQAMSAGRALVGTGKATQGLFLRPGSDSYIADSSDTFSAHAIKLFKDAELRKKTGNLARRTILEHHDWKAARAKIEQVLNQLFAVPIEPLRNS